MGARLDASVDFFRSVPTQGSPGNLVSAILREKLGSRISISEALQSGGRQKTLAMGGGFESHWLSIGVDYQTIYVPFYLPGQPVFREVLQLHVRWLLPRDVELHADTDTTPRGQVRYSVYASGLTYRDTTAATLAGPMPHSRLRRFVVEGEVRDSDGQPVWGAAILLDGQLVYSDSDGTFMARFSKSKEMTVKVMLEEFLLAGHYEVISASEKATAMPQSVVKPVQIVLRRMPL